MSAKVIILFILSLIMTVILFGVGIYFLSIKFLDKLNESSAVKSAKTFAKNKSRAKGSAYVALALGAITLVWAIMLISFPQIMQILALAYMIALFICCIILVVLYK